MPPFRLKLGKVVVQQKSGNTEFKKQIKDKHSSEVIHEWLVCLLMKPKITGSNLDWREIFYFITCLS